MKILAVDIGGSHVKVLASGETDRRKFDSGIEMTPEQMVEGVLKVAEGWDFNVVSLGYPGIVGHDGPQEEPANLARGWVDFDYEKAFGKPVRIVNDAVMQALGAYDGGRMLFLGLGTGLGSALLTERVVIPLDLGRLPHGESHFLFERLSKGGREKYGHKKWMRMLGEATKMLRGVMLADYVMLGGGHAEEVDPLPEGVRRGHNDDAFRGGFRLWLDDVEPHDRPPSNAWRVVR